MKVRGEVEIARLLNDDAILGTFELATAWFEASVNVREDTEDPAGRERKRNVSFEKVGRAKVNGEVYWGDKSDDTPAGSVRVSTSLAPVTLTV